MGSQLESTKTAIQYCRPPDLAGLEIFRSVSIRRSVSGHSHEQLCLTATEDGVRILTTRKGRAYLTPGTVYISNCGAIHSGTVPAGSAYSCRSLRFDKPLLAKLFGHLGLSGPAAVHFADQPLSDPYLFQEVLAITHTAAMDSSLLRKESDLLALFAELIGRHALSAPGRKAGAPGPAPIHRTCEYLQDCYADNVSLEQLALIAGLSPFHLCRAFNKEVGVPPHVYQLDVRLIRAAHLLARGKPIVTVAADTGFFDQSHFHRAFKRKYGVTPGQYKKS